MEGWTSENGAGCTAKAMIDILPHMLSGPKIIVININSQRQTEKVKSKTEHLHILTANDYLFSDYKM